MTADTGAYVTCLARKTAADGYCRILPYLERSFPDSDPGMAPNESLGIRRQYHNQVHSPDSHPPEGLYIAETAGCYPWGSWMLPVATFEHVSVSFILVPPDAVKGILDIVSIRVIGLTRALSLIHTHTARTKSSQSAVFSPVVAL
jgi:hypothetical protein